MTTDISTEADEALNSLRSELVDALEGIVGLKVTADPTQVNPPCVVVGVPSVQRVALLRPGRWQVDVDVPVHLVAPPPAQPSSIQWLLRYVLRAMRVTNATDALPIFTDEFGNQTLPAYTLTVSKQLRIEEPGS